MKWIWDRCRDRQQDICLLAAGALSEEEKTVIEHHFAECGRCQNYYAGIKALTAPLADWEKSLSAIESTPAAQLRWVRAVQASGATTERRESLLQRGRQVVWRELILPSRYAWGGMAA